MNSIDGPFFKSSTLTYRTRDSLSGCLFFVSISYKLLPLAGRIIGPFCPRRDTQVSRREQFGLYLFATGYFSL